MLSTIQWKEIYKWNIHYTRTRIRCVVLKKWGMPGTQSQWHH